MKHLFIHLIAFILSLAVGPTAKAQDAVSRPIVQAIETQVVMPRGADSLDLYDRYYAIEQLNGYEVVTGVFLLRSSFGTRTWAGASAVADVPNAFAISRKELPVIMDGGCTVVTVHFSIATQKLFLISREGVDAEAEFGVCNGRA